MPSKSTTHLHGTPKALQTCSARLNAHCNPRNLCIDLITGSHWGFQPEPQILNHGGTLSGVIRALEGPD